MQGVERVHGRLPRFRRSHGATHPWPGYQPAQATAAGVTATGARVVWREAVEVAVHPRRCEVLEALEGDAGLSRVHWILGTTEAGQEACLVNEPSLRKVVGQFLDATALLNLLLVEDDAHAVFGHADHDLRTALEEHPGRNLLVNANGGDLRLCRDVNLARQRHLGLSSLFLGVMPTTSSRARSTISASESPMARQAEI